MILHAAERQAGAGGAPVLLLHGLFGQGRNLGVIQRRFAERRTIAMDLRNHGASGHAAGMGYAAMAADVRQTARERHAWPALVVGHSMGGKVAMRLALDHPAEVLGMVAMDIAPVRYPPHFGPVVQAMRAMPLTPGMTRRDADAALADAVPDAALRGFLLQNLEPGTEAADGPAWRLGLDAIADGLPEIEDFVHTGRYDGPALFVSGRRSRYVQQAHHATIADLFPAARLASCDTGHWLHAEDPDCVCAHLRAFFDEVSG